MYLGTHVWGEKGRLEKKEHLAPQQSGYSKTSEGESRVRVRVWEEVDIGLQKCIFR